MGKLITNLLAMMGLATIAFWLILTNPQAFTRIPVIAEAMKQDLHAMTSSPSSVPKAVVSPEAGKPAPAQGKNIEQITTAAKASAQAYFNHLRLKNYGAAYAQLAPEFFEGRNLTLDTYADWWRQYSVSMGPVTAVAGNSKELQLVTQLRFTGPNGARLSGLHAIGMVQQNNVWKISYLTKNVY